MPVSRARDARRSSFHEGHVKSNFLCNLGYGDHSKLFQRSPRLTFSEACSLVVMRSDHSQSNRTEGDPMAGLGRILCAIDLEKASERAFDRALNLAVISEAKLYLLHATPASVPFSWRASERLRYLTELRERAEAAGVKVRVDEQHGDPARVIVLHANARKMDLVVLGSNRRRGWRRLREGSVVRTRTPARGMASAHCSLGCSSGGRARQENVTEQFPTGRGLECSGLRP